MAILLPVTDNLFSIGKLKKKSHRKNVQGARFDLESACTGVYTVLYMSCVMTKHAFCKNKGAY